MISRLATASFPEFRTILLAVASLATTEAADAVEAVLTDDISVSRPPAARAAKGDSQLLSLSESEIVYLWFNIDAVLPTDTTADQVAKATLKLWVHRVSPKGQGQGSVAIVTTWWRGEEESLFTFGQPPEMGAPYTRFEHGRSKEYLVVDVTEHVRKWLSGTPNLGFAIQSFRTTQTFYPRDDPRAQWARTPLIATFDSKENTGTGHAPSLQIVLK